MRSILKRQRDLIQTFCKHVENIIETRYPLGKVMRSTYPYWETEGAKSITHLSSALVLASP